MSAQRDTAHTPASRCLCTGRWDTICTLPNHPHCTCHRGTASKQCDSRTHGFAQGTACSLVDAGHSVTARARPTQWWQFSTAHQPQHSLRSYLHLASWTQRTGSHAMQCPVDVPPGRTQTFCPVAVGLLASARGRSTRNAGGRPRRSHPTRRAFLTLQRGVGSFVPSAALRARGVANQGLHLQMGTGNGERAARTHATVR